MNVLWAVVNFFENHPWIILALVFHFLILGIVAYLILLERKTASWVQDRLGPNRVGLDFGILPFKFLKRMNGFGQPLADGIKFIVKEDYRPRHVDRILFTIAPAIMIIVIIVSIAVLPWGGWKEGTKLVNVTGVSNVDAAIQENLPDNAEILNKVPTKVPGEPGTYVEVTYRWPFQIAQLNIGVLFVLAVLSLAVYGVVLGGWASNNKYSFLGGLRATANMISYEIPLGLSVLCIVLMFGTLDMNKIVEMQCHNWVGVIPAWNVFSQPLAFLLFLVCIHAEANRAPFDLAEAEQELVGGYHTEYSAMRFALFFLAEYAGMVTTSAVCVALFFGGWDLPIFPSLLRGHPAADPNGYINPAVTSSIVICILRALVFLLKTLVIIFVFMWVRWSLPRFRFDQLMMLAWRSLIPISLALFMMTGVCLYLTRDPVRFPHAFGRMGGQEALVLLVLGNLLPLVVTMLLSRFVLPAAPATNRRVIITNSRFRKTPLPGTPVGAPALNVAAARKVAVDLVPASTGDAR